MTKEEYNNLLQSDYWRGYSYSIIKERNFTCQDCGRKYPNMRNMLQVHHLVYRDVNPWSYKPEEVIVLCKECHQKRHGIYQTPDIEEICESIDNVSVYSIYHKPRRNWIRFTLLGCIVAVIINFVSSNTPKKQITTDNKEIPTTNNNSSTSKVKVKSVRKTNENLEIPVVPTKEDVIISVPIEAESTLTSIIDNEAESYIKSFEEDNHAKVVKQARRAGVSTEGTTDEILERINHAKAVKQAKRAGVSTEGTTDEILDRINHAKVVKQAKRAGVSTEGTTKEILERIKQKNMGDHIK